MLAECRTRRGKLWRIATVLAASGALALSGCVDNSESSEQGSGNTAATATKVDEIANSVPDAVKSTGKLVVGTDPTYAAERVQGRRGQDHRLRRRPDERDRRDTRADRRSTGSRRSTRSSRPMQGGTYNVGMSSFTDSQGARGEGRLRHLLRGRAPRGRSRRARASTRRTPAASSVAVQTATVQDTDEMPARTQKCIAEGKPAIDVVQFDDQDAATTAVSAGPGRCDVGRLPGHVVCDQAERRASSRRPVRSSTRRPTVGAVQKGSPLAEPLQAGAGASDRDGHLQAGRRELGRPSRG